MAFGHDLEPFSGDLWPDLGLPLVIRDPIWGFLDLILGLLDLCPRLDLELLDLLWGFSLGIRGPLWAFWAFIW